MYSLAYTDKFRRQFKKLGKNIQKRVISALERIRIRPYPHVKKLVGYPYYSLRAGSYRIILDIAGDKLVIYSLEVGHRKKVYK